jgi:hypothetical protein
MGISGSATGCRAIRTSGGSIFAASRATWTGVRGLYGLAIFQKNDPADARIDARTFDGMIDEECNRYQDPCAGQGGDGTPYLTRGKPVLNAEYVEDGETTAKFCPADVKAGIGGALFNVDLNGRTYEPCAPASQASTVGYISARGAARAHR